MTVAEAKEVSSRDDVQARLDALLDDARGFFESDAEWDVRRKAAMSAPLPKPGGKGAR
jgi:hypothetical protein